jgi:hypothetical protein
MSAYQEECVLVSKLHGQVLTFVPSLNFMPCFVSERWKALRISPSCKQQQQHKWSDSEASSEWRRHRLKATS